MPLSGRGWFGLAVPVASFAVGIALSGPASAAPILPGTWYEFGFTDAGDPATGCDPADPAGPFCTPSSGTPTVFAPEPAWTFALGAGGGSLRVTDAFATIDRFQVFDFGVSLGLTSVPAAGVDCGDDPVPCFASPAASHALFALGAGAHSITITPTLSPDGQGAGYFRVDAAEVVPEPASLLLIATGLGLGARRRRR